LLFVFSIPFPLTYDVNDVSCIMQLTTSAQRTTEVVTLMQFALTLIPVSSVPVKVVTPEMGSPAQVKRQRTRSTPSVTFVFS